MGKSRQHRQYKQQNRAASTAVKGPGQKLPTPKPKPTSFPGALSTTELLNLTLTSGAGPKKRKIQNYLPSQRILLVGEGDFTFSRALTVTFGSGKNIVATSLDSKKQVLEKYPTTAYEAIKEIEKYDGCVVNNVNALKLSLQADISKKGMYDRIVFNFPHVGGSLEEDIQRNQNLLQNFLLQAARLLKKDGEIHITLRKTPFYDKWHVETLAEPSKIPLDYIGCMAFEGSIYSALGYKPQRTNPAVREAPSLDNAVTYRFSLQSDMKHKARDVALLSKPDSAAGNNSTKPQSKRSKPGNKTQSVVERKSGIKGGIIKKSLKGNPKNRRKRL